MADCLYGTRVKAGQPTYVSATPTDIAGWLGYTSDWLANLIQRTGTLAWSSAGLCAALPPTIPTMAPADWLDPIKVGAYIAAFAATKVWDSTCECATAPAPGVGCAGGVTLQKTSGTACGGGAAGVTTGSTSLGAAALQGLASIPAGANAAIWTGTVTWSSAKAGAPWISIKAATPQNAGRYCRIKVELLNGVGTVLQTSTFNGPTQSSSANTAAQIQFNWTAGSFSVTADLAYTIRLTYFNDSGAPLSMGAGLVNVQTGNISGYDRTFTSGVFVTPAYTYYRQSVTAPGGQQYDALDWAGGTTANVAAVQMEWHVPTSEGGDLGAGAYTSELRTGTATGGSACADLVGATSILFNSSATLRTTLLCPHTAITTPPAPTPIAEPSGLPEPTAYTCSTTADLCTLLNYVLADIQHLFAAISSTDDRIDALAAECAALQSDMDTRLSAIAITAGDTLSSAESADTNAGVAADRAALLLLDTAELLNPAAGVLASHALVTGDNSFSVPAGTHEFGINVAGIPIWWGYRGLSPREYEPLGWLTTTAASGQTPITLLRWAANTVPVRDALAITGVVVHLEPPLTGTLTVLGKA